MVFRTDRVHFCLIKEGEEAGLKVDCGDSQEDLNFLCCFWTLAVQASSIKKLK